MSFILVVSFPSEKAPAPPSPNCTLDSGFNSPVFQNSSTVLVLESTSSPLSKTIGLNPFLANKRAAKSPAGPNPITTGLCSSFFSPKLKSKS